MLVGKAKDDPPGYSIRLPIELISFVGTPRPLPLLAHLPTYLLVPTSIYEHLPTYLPTHRAGGQPQQGNSPELLAEIIKDAVSYTVTDSNPVKDSNEIIKDAVEPRPTHSALPTP